jgi:hypothetical protein
MKLATIALASAFALSSTFALAHTSHHYTSHHKYKTVRTHQGTVGMGRSMNPGGGGSNSRGGLVGGADPVLTSLKSKRRVSAGLRPK